MHKYAHNSHNIGKANESFTVIDEKIEKEYCSAQSTIHVLIKSTDNSQHKN